MDFVEVSLCPLSLPANLLSSIRGYGNTMIDVPDIAVITDIAIAGLDPNSDSSIATTDSVNDALMLDHSASVNPIMMLNSLNGN